MTLTEIKHHIEAKLNRLTIDDYYADPKMRILKSTFLEITGLEKTSDIEEYLDSKFIEASFEKQNLILNKPITDLKNKKLDLERSINYLQSDIDLYSRNADFNRKRLDEIPELQNKLISELNEIETEINDITPRGDKPPYNSHLKALQEKKGKIKNKHDSYHAEILKLNIALDEIQVKIKGVQEKIDQKKIEIDPINVELLDYEGPLKQLHEKKEKGFFDEEYSSLTFLYLMLINIYIDKYQEKSIMDRYANRFPPTQIIKENIIPNDWRKILYSTLSKPIPQISGKFSEYIQKKDDEYSEPEFKKKRNPKYDVEREDEEDYSYHQIPLESEQKGHIAFFKRVSLGLTHLDTSILLATKIAVRTNSSIKTTDNKIILALSGGLSATISFRKKGEIIAEFQEEPFEIYANCLLSDQYVFQTLYYQTGYANSEVKVNTPGAYYMLTEEFVIEISYSPAPVLFDNNSIVKFAPNIAGIAKQEDEEKAREEMWDDLK